MVTYDDGRIDVTALDMKTGDWERNDRYLDMALWTRIHLIGKGINNATNLTTVDFEIPNKQNGDFYSWLARGSRSGRFMSFGFASAGGQEDIYDAGSRWNLEVEANPSWWNDFRSKSPSYEVLPHKDNGGGSL